MSDQKLLSISTAPQAISTGAARSVNQLCAFWEQRKLAVAIKAVAAAAAVDSETESDVDSDSDPTADGINIVTCADANVGRLPDFDVVAVLFVAAFANWLAVVVIDVLPPAIMALLNISLLIFASAFSRVCEPGIKAASRFFSPVTSVVERRLLWSACLIAHHAQYLHSSAASVSAAKPDAAARGFTEDYDRVPVKICAMLYSSQCGDVLQRARVNQARDMLHDLDLQFLELDMATTIDLREILAMRRLIEASNLRGYFPQVFTVEIGTNKPVAERIRYITPKQLRKAEFFFGTPVTELARLHLLGASVHSLFSGVPKLKSKNAFADEVLALPAGVLLMRPTAAGLFKHWRGPKAKSKSKAREPLETETAWVRRRACLFKEVMPLEMMLI